MADGGFDIPQTIITTAGQYGVDPDLALSVAHAESNLNPSARSPKGAVGVMQLMPDTATGLGVDPHDVHQNIIGGVKYLKQLSDKYGGDHRLVAAAYNAGPGAVDKHGGVPPYPETQAYVDKVAGPDTSAMPSADDIEAHIANPGAVSIQPLPNVPGYVSDPGYTPPAGEENNPAWQAPAVPLGGDAMPSADDIQAQLGVSDEPAAPQGAPPIIPTDPASGVTGFMANLNRGLGVGDELAAGGNALGSLSKDLLSGRVHLDPNDLHGSLRAAEGAQFDASLGRQRQLEAGFTDTHPHLSALGQGVGMAASVAGLEGENALRGVNLVRQGSRLGNIARGAAMAGLTGAGFAAADAGTPSERLQAAASASHNPLVLGLGAAGGALAPATSRAPASAAAATLDQAGVPLTVGQRGGALAHRLEDAAESLPLTGSAIRARRIEGLEGFNRAAINEALGPISQTVTGAGRDAISQANQHISGAYETALRNVAVNPDAAYMRGLNAITTDSTLPASVRNDAADIVREFVTDPIAGDSSGNSWKRIDSDLNTLIRSADNAAGSTPQSLSLRRVLQRIQDVHWDLLERQSPQAAQDVGAADAANAAMERVRSAAATTATAGRDGLFTASDLNRAVATKGGRSGKRAYGQGTALMQDLSDAGQAVLPSKIPDSGTALRAAITRIGAAGGALAGVGAVGGHDAAVPSALGALGADLAGATFYSRGMQNLLRGRRAVSAVEYLSARSPTAVGVYGTGTSGTPSVAPPANALTGVRLAR